MSNDFCPATIEARIQQAIRPQMLRADQYVWELNNPRKQPGVHDPDHVKFCRHQMYINPVTGDVWFEPIPPSEWWKPAYHHRLQPRL